MRNILRDGLTARRATASGRKGATRWEVYEGEEWLGDFVRFSPEGVWDWQPAEGPDISGRDPYAVAREAGISGR